jgi:peroxiredoxin
MQAFMMVRLSWLVLFLFSVIAVSGKGLQISLKIDSAPGKQILLAHYYGSNVFVDDTLQTDSNGAGTFSRDTLLPQGMYKIYLDKDHHFDFLLGADQTLSIRNRDFGTEKLFVEGAKESVEFNDYLKWLRVRQEERGRLDSALVKAGPDEKKEIESRIEALTGEVTSYWMKKAGQYPGTLLAGFLMANYFRELKPEEIPAGIASNDSLKWLYQYNYRKNHFFDHFDLTDQRFLYTPLIQSKLDTYFSKILLQMYDSVKPPAYRLISKVEPYPQVFRFLVSYLLNYSLSSRIMGMDALFVDIAKDFYLSGKAPWADSTTLAKIRENVIFMEPNLIGKKAPDVMMETLSGEPFRLSQHRSPYTVLAFFEPDCSHCKEYIPRLYREVYLPFRDRGLEVIAGYTMSDKKAWVEFIEKNHLNDWINVWDQHHLSRFKILYDTRTTPSVYLLDKERIIVAKKVTIEFLKEYLGHFLGPEAGK